MLRNYVLYFRSRTDHDSTELSYGVCVRDDTREAVRQVNPGADQNRASRHW